MDNNKAVANANEVTPEKRRNLKLGARDRRNALDGTKPVDPSRLQLARIPESESDRVDGTKFILPLPLPGENRPIATRRVDEDISSMCAPSAEPKKIKLSLDETKKATEPNVDKK